MPKRAGESFIDPGRGANRTGSQQSAHEAVRAVDADRTVRAARHTDCPEPRHDQPVPPAVCGCRRGVKRPPRPGAMATYWKVTQPDGTDFRTGNCDHAAASNIRRASDRGTRRWQGRGDRPATDFPGSRLAAHGHRPHRRVSPCRCLRWNWLMTLRPPSGARTRGHQRGFCGNRRACSASRRVSGVPRYALLTLRAA